MTDVESEYMKIDPERERIWRESEEPSFTEIREALTDEEYVEDELEQPEDTEDSINSAYEGEEEENDEEEETPLEDKVTESEVTPEDVVKSDTHKIKANGMEFDFTTEELKALAPKAMDYTKKMQEIAPWRKTISALKEQGMAEADVNLMIDALKGNKDAITEVLKRTQVDPLDLDIENKYAYIPNQYGKDEKSQALDEVIKEINLDLEYPTTVKVVDELWDNSSRDILSNNPDMILGLHNDIKDGTYDKVAPIAEKLRVLDGGRKPAIDYYIEAGTQYFNQQTFVQPQMQEVKVSDTRQTEIKEMANKRKAASPTKAGSSKRDVIDYLDDNDEEYDAWYKRVMTGR